MTSMMEQGKFPSKGGFILGIDIGTSTIKATLFHIESKKAWLPIVKPVKAKVSDPAQVPLSDLQSPKKIFNGVHTCVRGYPPNALARVQRIAICGQMHGVMLWKQSSAWKRSPLEVIGEHCSDLYTWQDQRCSKEFLDGLEKPDSYLRISNGFGCVTLLWLLKNQPELIEKYDRAGTIMDFIVALLTNSETPKMSTHNATSWGYFDPIRGNWNESVLQSMGLPMCFLPQVVPFGANAGDLQETWNFIPPGTPVCVAFGDMQCAIRATLNTDIEHNAVLNINTSAQMALVMPKSFTPNPLKSSNSAIEYVPYAPNRYLAVCAALNGGNALGKFVEMLQMWLMDLGLAMTQDQIWAKVVQLQENDCESDCQNSLEIEPLLYGERHDPDIRGLARNIRPDNINLSSVIKGICKGIANNVASMMPRSMLEEHQVTKILASGECLKKHKAIQSALMSEYGLPVEIFDCGGSCVGAALFCMDKWYNQNGDEFVVREFVNNLQ